MKKDIEYEGQRKMINGDEGVEHELPHFCLSSS